MRRLTTVSARKLFVLEREGVLPLTGAWSASRFPPCTARPCTCLPWRHALLVLRRPDHLGQTSRCCGHCPDAVAIADQLIPFLLVARHDEPEVIIEHWMPAVRRLVFLALPLTFPILISTTMSRLLEPKRKNRSRPARRRTARVIEAGEQEGLLEKGEGDSCTRSSNSGTKSCAR